MPVEWPIVAPAANRFPATVRPARPGRLASVRADFFIDDAHRLSEQERALMGAMLADLLDQALDELLAHLPPLLSARVEPSRQRIAGRLWEDGSLAGDGLVALLLRRSDEQRLMMAGRRSAEGSGLVDQLVADPDEGIAVAAMALTVGRGRRRDRFGRLGIELDDLSREDAERLAFHLAAAVRFESGVNGNEADDDLARAAGRLVERHDPEQSLDGLVEALATVLADAGRATPEAIDAYCREGEAGLASALLGLKAGIGPATAWCLMIEERADGLMLLARLAGFDRPGAARLIAALGEVLGIADPASAIAHFDALAAAEVEERRGWFRLPQPYRDAVRWMGGHD